MRCIARLNTVRGSCRLFYSSASHVLQLRMTAAGRAGRPLWQYIQPLPRSHGEVRRAWLAVQGDRLIARWRERGRDSSLSFPFFLASAPALGMPAVSLPGPQAMLDRAVRNPMLQPLPAHEWESQAVFNAAAIELGGRVHFVYRAVGNDGLSTFGYAASSDGVNIDERGGLPIYDAGMPRAYAEGDAAAPCDYGSGPSRGGCEDPRLTRVDDTLYMTYTAFDGQHPPGVALTSIAVADFVARRWEWKAPVLISPLHEAHKNWVVFPERIGGGFAVLHGISPGIMIDFRPKLDFPGGTCIESHFAYASRDGAWDNRPRGAGPPPIKTPAGWLLIYHAMDRNDPGRYKLGVMLLDLTDPRRVLGRLPYPLLQPAARYENDGCKAGVVYACGAALIGETLHVYYGGADTVVCAATVPLRRLLAQLRPAAAPTHRTDDRRPHDDVETRSRQPLAFRQQGIVLGIAGRIQSQRRRGPGHPPPRLPGAVRPHRH